MKKKAFSTCFFLEKKNTIPEYIHIYRISLSKFNWLKVILVRNEPRIEVETHFSTSPNGHSYFILHIQSAEKKKLGK